MGTCSTQPRTRIKIPAAFVWRRVNSLFGLGLVLFVSQHLLINVQAVLWPGQDGRGLIALANFLQSIPVLPVIEIGLIGVPIASHAIWGIQRAWSAQTNVWPSSGTRPSLFRYERNWAFTMQRVSAWILIVGVVAHVVQMRFIANPVRAVLHNQERALVRVSWDDGLDSLAKRLQVSLFSAADVVALQRLADQASEENKTWAQKLSSFSLDERHLVAAAPDRGTAILLTIRDTFKNPMMEALYTIFVVAAVFHAFNGCWTFLLTWGWIASAASQKIFRRVSWAGMLIFAWMGLTAVWTVFWINLRS